MSYVIEAEWSIYASMNLVIIGFDNGLLPNRRQAIFETNDDLVVKWTLRNKSLLNLNQFSNIFIEENAFENVVWEQSAVLSQPRCVKPVVCVCCMISDFPDICPSATDRSCLDC